MAKELKPSAVYQQGKSDSKRRWEFTDSRVGEGNYCKLCDTYLRHPSAAFPYSVLKHAFTQKHARACINAGVCAESDLQE